jgi:hypothetical protein
MTTDNFCFYLQNKLIQTSQTGGQQYSDTSPLVYVFFPGVGIEPGIPSFFYLIFSRFTAKPQHFPAFEEFVMFTQEKKFPFFFLAPSTSQI